MELVTVWVKPDDVRDGLKSLVRLVGEPLADPAWIGRVAARRGAQDIKLALVAGARMNYSAATRLTSAPGVAEHFARLPPLRYKNIRRAVEALPPSEKKVTVHFLLKRFVQGMGFERTGAASTLDLQHLRRPCSGGWDFPVEAQIPDVVDGCLLDRVQQWDLETPLARDCSPKRIAQA